jgi:hypothetical protein
MTTPPTNANPTMTLNIPCYDPSGHQINVALRVTNISTDATTGTVWGDLSVSAGSNASVGATESPVPTSATLIGANDNAGNLEELLLESNANPNLRVAIYNAGNELSIDSNGVLKALLQVVSGTALVADQSNTELRVSAYVKTTTAGDTALTLGQATKANSVPFTLASDQGAIPVNNTPTMPSGTGMIFKQIKHVALTAGTPISIWTPTSGKKFRLMGYHISTSATTTFPNLLLLDSATEFARVPQPSTLNATYVPGTLSPIGYLSTTINNILKLDSANGDSPTNIDGYVYGYEE